MSAGQTFKADVGSDAYHDPFFPSAGMGFPQDDPVVHFNIVHYQILYNNLYMGQGYFIKGRYQAFALVIKK